LEGLVAIFSYLLPPLSSWNFTEYAA
jgi:hypothetical protein